MRLAEVLAAHWPAYAAQFGRLIPPEQRAAVRAILRCRTPALGGQRYRCACGREHFTSPNFYGVEGAILNIHDIIRGNLPLNPGEFEEFLRRQMTKHIESEKRPYASAIRWALNDYAREQKKG